MISRPSLLLIVMALLSIGLTGCNDQTEAAYVLPKVCQYFPGSVIYKFDKRVLWIQTNVDGISSAMAQEIFSTTCQKATQPFGKIQLNVVTELQLDGRSILIIGFKRGIVACDLKDGLDTARVPVGKAMSWKMAKGWLDQRIGYVPGADQIRVVTLDAVERTPKGQLMEWMTLAQIQSANKEKQQEAINEYVLKQKGDVTP